MRRTLSAAVLGFAFLSLPAVAAADPAELDPTFGSSGKTLSAGFPFAPVSGPARGEAMIVDPNDRVVVAGTHGSHWVFARFTADGAPDESFGLSGVSFQNLFANCNYGNATAIARQPDGKYLVAGRYVCGDPGFEVDHWAFARYNTNAQLDTSFSAGPTDVDGVPGLTYTHFSSTLGAAQEPRAISVHENGFVLSGYVTEGGVRKFAVARFDSNGQLDPAFSTDASDAFNGLAVKQVGSDWSEIDAMAVDPATGAILVGGSANGGSPGTGYGSFALGRYDATGALDVGFDVDGLVTSNVGVGAVALRDLIRVPGGKLLVGGSSDDGTRFALGRYSETTGAFDLSFDGDGLVTTPFTNATAAGVTGVARRSDGSIYAAGDVTLSAGPSQRFGLARYLDNGSPDTSFALGSGRTTSGIGDSGDDHVRGIGLQTSGKPVLAGAAFSGGQHQIAVARYKDDGIAAPPPDTTSPVVSLTRPAAESVVREVRPTFSGAAGNAAGDSTTITVELQGEGTSGFVGLPHLTATRSGATWSVTSDRDFAPGRYYARAHQSDSAGNEGLGEYVLFSVARPSATVSAPVNVAAPEITGQPARIGAKLSGSVGSWSGGGTITYYGLWQRCPDTVIANCENITGGEYPTNSVYEVNEADAGFRLVFSVFAINEAGTGGANSAQTAVVPFPSGGAATNGAGAGNPRLKPPLPAKAPEQRSSACQAKLNFGPIGVEGECLKRVGLTWESTASVEVNGIRLVPSGGAAKVIIDPMNLRVSADGNVAIIVGPATALGRTLGPYTLWKGSFDWVFQPNIRLPDVPGLATAIDIGKNALENTFGGAKAASVNLERFSYADLQKLPGLDRLPELPRLKGLGLPDFSKLTVADLKALRVPTLDDVRKMQIPAYYLQNVQLPALALDTKAANIFGFGVQGKAAMQLVDDGANFQVSLALAQFGNLSASAAFKLTNAGQIITEKVKAHADEVPLGLFSLRPFDINYDGSKDEWKGTAVAFLPFPKPIGLGTSVRVQEGKLRKAGIIYDGSLALGTSGVFVSHLDVDYDHGPPKILQSGITLTAGPTIAKLPPAFALNGRFTFIDATSGGDPAKFALTGDAKVVGNKLANAGIEYHTNGYFHAAGNIGISLDSKGSYKIAGDIDGWATKTKFNLEGGINFKTPGYSLDARGVVSSVGIAGCSTQKGGLFNGFSLGAGYKWHAKSIDWLGGSCDLGPYRAEALARTSQAGGSRSVELTRGQAAASFAIRGAGAAPRVTLTGPGGAVVTTPAVPGGSVRDDRFLLIQDDLAATTYIVVAKPAGGTWTVTVQPGSVPVTSVDQADALPPIDVRAQVRGKRAKQRLRWSMTARPGQVVRFVERSSTVARVLKETSAASGTVSFSPADGPRGKRTIEAIVEQGGLVRKVVPVASFVAPAPVRPAAPKRVRAKLRRGKLVVTWAASAGATRYRVLATVNGGRRTLVTATKSRRSATIRDVFAEAPVKVAVFGVDSADRSGKAGRTSLKVKRAKKPVLRGLKAPRKR